VDIERADIPGTRLSGAMFSVSNGGIGIPASELEAVFDKFVQSTKD
jgi:signal transduction histidine kinase